MMETRNRYVVPKRRWRFPSAMMRDYARILRAVARALAEATKQHMALIDSHLRTDESESEFILRIIREAYEATGTTAAAMAQAQRIAEQVKGYNEQEFYAVLRSVMGVNIFIQAPDLRRIMDEFAAENVRLIKSIPEQYFDKLQGVVSRGLQEGAMTRDVAGEIRELYGVTSKRSQLIARDQIGSLNGMISQSRQIAAGIGAYKWSTSRDSRVRESHTDREGRYYAWPGSGMAGKIINGKTVLTLFNGKPPGMEIDCRCVALPIIDTKTFTGGMKI